MQYRPLDLWAKYTSPLFGPAGVLTAGMTAAGISAAGTLAGGSSAAQLGSMRPQKLRWLSTEEGGKS